MALIRIITVVVFTMLLAGCPGSTIQPLPAGSGQGDYLGNFANEDDTDVWGTLEMEIDELGVMEGEGVLLGRDVEMSGILIDNNLEGFITDSLTNLTGEFVGRRIAGGMTGEFDLDQDMGQPDLEGIWNAVLVEAE